MQSITNNPNLQNLIYELNNLYTTDSNELPDTLLNKVEATRNSILENPNLETESNLNILDQVEIQLREIKKDREHPHIRQIQERIARLADTPDNLKDVTLSNLIEAIDKANSLAILRGGNTRTREDRKTLRNLKNEVITLRQNALANHKVEGENFLMQLPVDVVSNICSHLDTLSIKKLMETSKEIKSTVDNEMSWHAMVEKREPRLLKRIQDEDILFSSWKRVFEMYILGKGSRIYINNFYNGKTGTSTLVDYYEEETTLELKKRLAKQIHHPVGEIQIIFSGKILEDDVQLKEYNPRSWTFLCWRIKPQTSST